MVIEVLTKLYYLTFGKSLSFSENFELYNLNQGVFNQYIKTFNPFEVSPAEISPRSSNREVPTHAVKMKFM